MLDSVIDAREVEGTGIYPRIALEAASKELLACVTILTAKPNSENRVFTAVVRDRLLQLTLHHGAEDARCLLDKTSALFRLLVSTQLVDTLLGLPAPTLATLAPRPELLPSDPRWLISGVLSYPPHQLNELGDWLDDIRYAAILMHYATWRPKCFETDAERGLYYAHATRLCAMCADFLDRESDTPQTQLAKHAVETLSSGVIYSCEGTLREFAEAKGGSSLAFFRRSFPI